MARTALARAMMIGIASTLVVALAPTAAAMNAVILTPADGATYTVGEPIQFLAEPQMAQGCGGAPDFVWNFDDGGDAFVGNTTHTFSAEGDYTVTVDITKGGCSAQDSVLVHIVAAPPPVPELPTLALVGLGLVGLVLAVRFGRK